MPNSRIYVAFSKTYFFPKKEVRIKAWQAIQAAERETGIVGKSSADETYAAALKAMGLDASGLVGHPNAAKAAFTALKSRPARRAAMATDAKAVDRRSQMFPNANRLVNGGLY